MTWKTLQDIAVEPRMVASHSSQKGPRRFVDIFGQSPSAIVDNRPETDMGLLKHLKGKEHDLHQASTRDLAQRSLWEDDVAAVRSLGSPSLRIHRAILAEVLQRCMFLKRWSDKHTCVAAVTTWDELVQRCVQVIGSFEITDEAPRSPFSLKCDNRTSWSQPSFQLVRN